MLCNNTVNLCRMHMQRQPGPLNHHYFNKKPKPLGILFGIFYNCTVEGPFCKHLYSNLINLNKTNGKETYNMNPDIKKFDSH